MMNKTIIYNLMTLLKKKFGKPKSIQVTSMTKEEWANIILKLNVEYIAVTIDCHSYRKRIEHYIENIPKVIDSQKTIFDMTNYPGYVIIYMSSDNDLSTLRKTYNSLYNIYGEATKIELLSGKFYKDKDSGNPMNEIQFSFKELPISFIHFNEIINSIYI